MQESPEKANKVLAVQLEKNLKILEHDYNLMVFRIQSTMNKVNPRKFLSYPFSSPETTLSCLNCTKPA